MIKKLLLAVILCCSISASSSEKPVTENWKELYAQQVYANEQLIEHEQTLKNHISAQDKIIDGQDKDIEKFKIQEKERMLFDLFGVGVSKDEVKGVIFGVLAVEVNPIFICGLLF